MFLRTEAINNTNVFLDILHSFYRILEDQKEKRVDLGYICIERFSPLFLITTRNLLLLLLMEQKGIVFFSFSL